MRTRIFFDYEHVTLGRASFTSLTSWHQTSTRFWILFSLKLNVLTFKQTAKVTTILFLMTRSFIHSGHKFSYWRHWLLIYPLKAYPFSIFLSQKQFFKPLKINTVYLNNKEKSTHFIFSFWILQKKNEQNIVFARSDVQYIHKNILNKTNITITTIQ